MFLKTPNWETVNETPKSRVLTINELISPSLDTESRKLLATPVRRYCKTSVGEAQESPTSEPSPGGNEDPAYQYNAQFHFPGPITPTTPKSKDREMFPSPVLPLISPTTVTEEENNGSVHEFSRTLKSRLNCAMVKLSREHEGDFTTRKLECSGNEQVALIPPPPTEKIRKGSYSNKFASKHRRCHSLDESKKFLSSLEDSSAHAAFLKAISSKHAKNNKVENVNVSPLRWSSHRRTQSTQENSLQEALAIDTLLKMSSSE
ncbi:DNA-binding protein SRL3 [Saccharomyces paradoxus]|uniref:DNA-binding protein SRL3 n=1 Tax=Saccharomyces paradoxus TaxID=27291 RepID=A0A8B8UVB3_SACPA|nr:Srl3 [Saccharomyces paradoxus]QHS74677.1 Srl3 [Saccharomyces paradoxus]